MLILRPSDCLRLWKNLVFIESWATDNVGICILLAIPHGFIKSRLPVVYRCPWDLSPPSVDPASRRSCLGFRLTALLPKKINLIYWSPWIPSVWFSPDHIVLSLWIRLRLPLRLKWKSTFSGWWLALPSRYFWGYPFYRFLLYISGSVSGG